MIGVSLVTLIAPAVFNTFAGDTSTPPAIISVTIENEELILLISVVLTLIDEVYWFVSVALILAEVLSLTSGFINIIFCATFLDIALAYSIPDTVSVSCSLVVALFGYLK